MSVERLLLVNITTVCMREYVYTIKHKSIIFYSFINKYNLCIK